MRDINRIKPFCNQFAKIWAENFPDQRFGQLISNFFGWVISEGKCHDIFFPEDDKWIKWLEEYASER